MVSRSRHLVVLRAALGFGVMTVAGTAIGQQYALTPLLMAAGASMVATDINELGQVVGRARMPEGQAVALLWKCGELTPLRPLPNTYDCWPYGMNGRGEIVGVCYTQAGSSAVLWVMGEPYDLGIGDGDADAINKYGEIVGAGFASGRSFAYRWKSGNWWTLPTLGGRDANAYDINDQGEIVGDADTREERPHACLWVNGEPADLGTLGGTYSYAYGINDRDQVVGQAALPSEDPRAFVWESGKMRDLGTLGGRMSIARDINESGAIVGLSLTTEEQVACLWREGLPKNLNEFLPPNSGWVLQDALAINDAGQIVGQADVGQRQYGFVLTPRPCNIFLTGDANCDGEVNNFDIDPFALALTVPAGYAYLYPRCNWLCNLDANGDGIVNNFDIDPFVKLLTP